MKNEITTKELNALIQQFKDLYIQGINSWIEAGKVLVRMLDADPNAGEYILKDSPHLNSRILNQFERMGRGDLNPHLLLGNGGEQSLSKMPLSLQNRYIDAPIPVVVHTADGTDILLVKCKDMTPHQRKQVFAKHHIRSEGEQKAWLIDEESKAAIAAKHCGSNINAWRIKNGKIEVLIAGTTFTAKDLNMMAAQLSK